MLIGVVACRGLVMAARGLFSEGLGSHEDAPQSRSAPGKNAAVASGTLPLLLLGALLILPWGRSDAQAVAAVPQVTAESTAMVRHSAAMGDFDEVYDLTALGHPKPVLLRGAAGSFRLDFGIPITKVVSEATLLLRYRAAPELVASESHLVLLLNGVEVETIPLVSSGTEAATEVRVTLPAELLGSDNELVFDLKGTLSHDAADSQSPVLTRIERDTQLQLSGKLLPLANDLALLPAPFFDRANSRPVQLPVVFSSRPSLSMIEAAGIVASYFGVLADYRGAHFPVSIGTFPAGNLLCFLDRSTGSFAGLDLEQLHGPVIAMRNNPSDLSGKLLIVMGDNSEEMLTAAKALSLHQFVRAGDASTITDFHMPRPMVEGSAPRWLQTNRVTPLANYALPEQLQVYGTGTVEIYFRVPPYLHFAAQETVPLRLNYRYHGVRSGHKGNITVKLNGTFVASVELPPDGQNESTALSRTLPVNVQVLSRFGNTLTFDFSFGNEKQTTDVAKSPALYGAILKDSTLDLRGVAGFAEMPNLALFGEAGFPFTAYPDLSRTAVVLPRVPTAEQIALALGTLASMGGRTGSPAVRVAVVDSEHLSDVSDRDLLVIGSGRDQPLFRSWPLPVRIDSDGFQLADVRNPLDRATLWLHSGYRAGRQQLAEVLGAANPPEAGAMEIESPERRGQTAVLLGVGKPW